MTTYSHSRLGTFQQCKYKYKLQYIDKIKSDLESIEIFMGKRVHEVLEKLYNNLKFQKLNTKEELLQFFEKIWDENWHGKVFIVKDEYTAKNYKEMGKKFIADYYDHYKPFNHRTVIAIETQDRLDLSEGYQYHIRIDHLACDKEGNYYVCDYKTNNSLKAQEELDEDHQLAMYSLWVKQKYPDAKSVKLVWYFLAFDKEMVSERNDEQLEELKEQIKKIIKEIEVCDKFPTNISTLCNYCQYKPQCPAWKHKFEVEDSKKEFSEDDGGKLVDDFSKLQETKKEAETKIEEIKKNLIEFSKQKGIDVVFGTDKKCSVKEYDKIIFPDDKKEELLKLIKEKGLYEEFSSLNYFKLSPKINRKEVDEDIINLTDKEKAHRLSLSKRKD
ncbi:MAG: PD-(D/E)XK nuclease family protein [Candidatus Woesearchaeota archaeon]